RLGQRDTVILPIASHHVPQQFTILLEINTDFRADVGVASAFGFHLLIVDGYFAAKVSKASVREYVKAVAELSLANTKTREPTVNDHDRFIGVKILAQIVIIKLSAIVCIDGYFFVAEECDDFINRGEFVILLDP